MNRADLVKIVQHQLQADVEAARVEAATSEAACRTEFRRVVAERVLERWVGVVEGLLRATGGNADRVVVDVKHELCDDVDDVTAVVRDGEEYNCTFRFVVHVHNMGNVRNAREEWAVAQERRVEAEAAGARMTDVKAAAWARVVGAALDRSLAGAELKAAARRVGAEMKRLGWSTLAGHLCTENESSSSCAPAEPTDSPAAATTAPSASTSGT